MLRDKAMRNQMVIQGDDANGRHKARILEILIVRFAYLYVERFAIDGVHTRGCSRADARMYGYICAYARLQSMMVC